MAFLAKVRGYIGLNDNEVIKFNDLNLANSFDGNLGVFQSPTTGFYVFIVNFLSLQSKYIEAQIIRNGISIQDVYAGDETHFGFGSNIAIVELEKGDRVWVIADFMILVAFLMDHTVHLPDFCYILV